MLSHEDLDGCFYNERCEPAPLDATIKKKSEIDFPAQSVIFYVLL